VRYRRKKVHVCSLSSTGEFLLNFGPNYIFRIGESRHFKFRVLIDTEDY